ncbi:MAG: hypothetical protein ABH834_08420 [Candidatus Altiarchaeota archaeon]
MKIDARGVDFKELNERVRGAVAKGANALTLSGVNGQRYIGCGVKGSAKILVEGVPGNDLAAFMDGPTITVKGNGQDAIGNTMNSGKVVIHGSAGDVLGYAMRGGEIYVKGDVGYRVGIHMKSYIDNIPVIVVGGTAGDFFGEYMAGGTMILLGLERGEKPIVGEWVGTGMHGGTIYIRGSVEDYQLGKEVKVFPVDKKEMGKIMPYLKEFARHFKTSLEEILAEEFIKLEPYSKRPYGKVYSY